MRRFTRGTISPEDIELDLRAEHLALILRRRRRAAIVLWLLVMVGLAGVLAGLGAL